MAVADVRCYADGGDGCGRCEMLRRRRRRTDVDTIVLTRERRARKRLALADGEQLCTRGTAVGDRMVMVAGRRV